ncbi:MAG: TonB-dependent receptor, partial [Candidatus Omnitrophota bacterium]|nr:TonB-dependent receptor [Candidatus Omnitrophota bacterium]
IDLDDRQEAFKQYIDLTYNGKMLEGQNMVFKLFHNSDRLEFIESYIPLDKDTHHTKVYGMDAQFSQELYGVFRPSIGLSYQEHRLNSSASSKHEYDLKGINFESEIKVFDSGSLKFGARWDDYSNFGDKISPSASFNYWLSDGVKLHALAAKAFRAPTFNDLYWPREDWGAFGGVEGNQNLSPEKAVSFESGISGYFMGSIKTDLTFFRTRFRDLIEWSVDNALWWRPGNVSLAVIEGAELEAEVVLNDHLKAEFNYTYLKAKNRTLGKWLIYRPRHMYKLRLVYSPVPKYELGLSSIFKTKRFANESNTSILEHYAILNSNFTYKINDSTQVLLEVKNLFDRQYEEEKDYPVPGRAFYTGVRLKF